MWILFLAVASFCAFLSILLLLWLADAFEQRQRCPDRKNNAPPFIVLSLTEAFEPAFAILWEAPIHALELIQAGGRSGLPASRLRPIFHEAAARFPEIYEGCVFEQWLQFLEGIQFIYWKGQQITLTREGHEFLEYRFTTEALADNEARA
jgi:hypothetical protein